jgi:uncharacterized protein YacL (UPF0231 family)
MGMRGVVFYAAVVVFQKYVMSKTSSACSMGHEVIDRTFEDRVSFN